jgi:hypothetical protein
MDGVSLLLTFPHRNLFDITAQVHADADGQRVEFNGAARESA